MTNPIYEISNKYLNLSSIDYIGEVYENQTQAFADMGFVTRSDFRFEVILRGQSREMVFETEDVAKSERYKLVMAWKEYYN